MKKIEPVEVEKTTDLITDVRDFWTRNVNAERLFGKKVSEHERGSLEYFADLEQQRFRSHRHLLPWIRTMISGKSVLDVGCGIGLDSYAMQKQGLDVTAIDLTDVAVQAAHKRFVTTNADGKFCVTNAEHLPFNNNSFDYVYSFGVMHHAPNTERCIEEAYRVLKKGGEAKIMLYHRHSLNELMHRILRVPFEEKDELCPVVRRFTKKEIRQMFKSYSSVDIEPQYVFGEGYGMVFRLTPLWLYKILSRVAGWHLLITAVK